MHIKGEYTFPRQIFLAIAIADYTNPTLIESDMEAAVKQTVA